MPELSALFPLLAAFVWITVPLYAALARGRFYAAFAFVILTLSIPGALVLHGRLGALFGTPMRLPLDALFAYSMAASGAQLAHLVRARLRGPAFRLLVSVPGQTFIAAGALAGPWLLLWLPVRALLGALGASQALIGLTLIEALPLVLAVVSIGTSLRRRHEIVRFALSDRGPNEFARLPVERLPVRSAGGTGGRPLRILQLTDTHLGPWQSVRRLREVVAGLVAREPDLIALTGDFLTMESIGSPGCLEAALAPLAPFADRSVAIFGNHDHEAPEQVRGAMASLGIPLLIDDEHCLETPTGPVQIVGSDFIRSDHAEHLSALLSRHPRREDHLRLLLLHDPLGFHALPDDEVDLVLSGHTHGGHVGLVSLGFDWTVMSRSRWPDQGLFGRGRTRLYVHRGTGFYGFPLRVGVPPEFSVLEVSRA